MLACEATKTKLVFLLSGPLTKTLKAQVTQTICSDRLPNGLNSLVGSNEFSCSRGIDPVIARGYGWRASDSHVHFGSPSGFDHSNNFSRGSASYDRVID